MQITSLFEIKDHQDYKLQEKKEQITIMEICDKLRKMRRLIPEFYSLYIEENAWANHIMSIYDDELFQQTQSKYDRGMYSAFR